MKQINRGATQGRWIGFTPAPVCVDRPDVEGGAGDGLDVASCLRLALIDANTIYRHGLASLLADTGEFDIVMEAVQPEALDQLGEGCSPAVVLIGLDIAPFRLPALATLASRWPVVGIFRAECPADVVDLLRNGGLRGAIFRSSPLGDVIGALRAAAAGGAWLPTPALEVLLHPEATRDTCSLTDREAEVSRHAALGLRNTEIAAKLFISEQTVKSHLNRVFHKLGVRDRVELALVATRSGLISPADVARTLEPGLSHRPPVEQSR